MIGKGLFLILSLVKDVVSVPSFIVNSQRNPCIIPSSAGNGAEMSE